ncbi:MAG TPA: complex I NDUFA9 subunit family protein [Hypericibacter adhaerens]|uniref:3-beta-hydroxy-Delta(5)-steroid dehydrogenase n=1 Tax=Hypericibacter adhaerens TaxID=2602016 RepID=A0A5J6MT56_9PROT|nr:complex I NDUFA9 subunit family protein [Hypericibacter adhaerens]QEX20307.1 3-beta-hydroxy-Delta(5)-steroid dehydrogenase [Hypericibacter adhaerens]HWA41825.1 complex I NDUFA9 subunit family protein [Hypericibacter adhaerens]
MARRLATVFGGSGFIGRYVVQRLAKQGWMVRAAVRRPDEALFLKPLGDVGQITPVAANLRHQGSVEAAVAGADAVVNLVGLLYQAGPQRFDAVHVEGAGRTAAAAAKAGASRFVQISAIGADPASPAAYARTKAAGEAAVRAAFARATVLRPSIVFGPEDQFFNRFAQMARMSPALPLIGGGHTKFQPVYVGDVADAVMAAIERPEALGQTYELGGPEIRTFRQLMELMLSEIERKRLLIPVPFALASLQGALLGLLPMPPLTLDQVRLLKRDNVVGAGMPGLKELGIDATALELILPTYLARYRPGGRHMRLA